MKSKFRVPDHDERVLYFDGYRINSSFRVSLLDACGVNDLSLAKVAKRAEVDFDRLRRFMKGEDGLLEYVEMERLIKAASPTISLILIAVGTENLACNAPGPDELPEYLSTAYQSRIDWSWEQYNKRGMEEDDE
jgi:hypothetical protein